MAFLKKKRVAKSLEKTAFAENRIRTIGDEQDESDVRLSRK